MTNIPDELKCHRCNGTGSVPAKEMNATVRQCPACEGSGRNS